MRQVTTANGITNDRLTSVVFRLANLFPTQHFLHKGPPEDVSSHCEVYIYLPLRTKLPMDLIGELHGYGFEDAGMIPCSQFTLIAFRAKRDLRTEIGK